MTGMRKRVAIGFLGIVCLLFFSGMISFVELSYLSRDTDEILKANERNIELAKEMLDAAHVQNMAMLRVSVFGERTHDSLGRAGMERIEQILHTARNEAHDKSLLDSLAFAVTEMRLLLDDALAGPIGGGEVPGASEFPALTRTKTTENSDTAKHRVPPASDTAPADSLLYTAAHLGHAWFRDQYQPHYDRLTTAIRGYMISMQGSLMPRAERLKTNAYRAVTPVLASLAVMIAIVLMLYYFMSVYCVNPIVRMNKSLGAYLAHRIPFASGGNYKDEVLGLQEKIETLIALFKQQPKP